MADRIERWSLFTTEEINAIRNSIGYAQMLGATYGRDREMDELKEKTNVVLRDREGVT